LGNVSSRAKALSLCEQISALLDQLFSILIFAGIVDARQHWVGNPMVGEPLFNNDNSVIKPVH
jgi:hypothetical protein